MASDLEIDRQRELLENYVNLHSIYITYTRSFTIVFLAQYLNVMLFHLLYRPLLQ